MALTLVPATFSARERLNTEISSYFVPSQVAVSTPYSRRMPSDVSFGAGKKIRKVVSVVVA